MSACASETTRMQTVSLCYVCCQTLCDPRTEALQVPLFTEFFQARIIEWVAISCSKGFAQPME